MGSSQPKLFMDYPPNLWMALSRKIEGFLQKKPLKYKFLWIAPSNIFMIGPNQRNITQTQNYAEQCSFLGLGDTEQ